MRFWYQKFWDKYQFSPKLEDIMTDCLCISHFSPRWLHNPGFLRLSASDIFDKVVLWSQVGEMVLHCGMVSNTPDLCPLDANST